jgi:CIC family chloride channel protein
MTAPESSVSRLTRWRRYLPCWLDQRGISESGILLLTALVVGIGAGLGAVVFRRLIEAVFNLTYGGLAGLLGGITPIQLFLVPALGGAIVGPLVYRFAREAKGHGVPEVMEAIALRGGRIRPRVAVVKALASAVCIGTGGSVGREGPIAQIGSALGSTLGQVLRLSDERVRNLVACGAAGGIAATFNAPIAGSVFALEVILGQLHATYFGTVVISAVIADVIAQVFEGDLRAFAIPEYALATPWELGFYAMLGVAAALISVAFARLLYLSEDMWDRLRLAEYVKPALGGLVLGVVGLLSPKIGGFPRVYSVGYETITEALFSDLAIQMAVALLVLKLLATIITLGSGGSGGVFAPSLFMGAMLGEAFGQAVHLLFPAITAPAGAYALVGMAAFFSGAAHAPITAIIIVFEMTRDYRIILPLMLATVISTLLSRLLSSDSIYTLKLSRRGVHLEQGQDIDVMQGVTVADAMTTEVDTVPLDLPLEELADEFQVSHHHGFPVLDGAGELAGVVTIQDLERAQAAGPLIGRVVADIATQEGLLVAYPYEPMWRALRRLGRRDVGRLPVVEREGSRRLVGAVRRVDIIRAYDQAIAARAQHQHRSQLLRLGQLDDVEAVHIDISPGSPVVGQRISALDLPEACLVVSVRRGRKLHLVHGYTELRAGDRLTIFAGRDCVTEVRQVLTGPTEEEAGPE